MFKAAELLEKWRAVSPGRSAAVYWGGFAVLAVMAAVPFILLTLTAPSSEVDRPVRLARSSPTVGSSFGEPAPSITPQASPSAGESGAAASPSPQAGGGPARARASRTLAPADTGPAGSDRFPDGEFDVQCWPTTAVVPGRTSTVDCRVLLTNGYSGDISLGCRIPGMECSLSPDRIHAIPSETAMTTRLTVTAPAGAPVSTRVASVTATGGESGAAQKHADVTVNVPPPFSVSCETVGAFFVQGTKAQVKCWVTFYDWLGRDVSLRLRNGAGVVAALDTSTLAPAPNQTRAFNIDLDTTGLPSRPYVLHVDAVSEPYRQEAAALFQVVPG
ncbi:MAG TPA: hypothetical protein VHJ78_01260 [Actinomycetota bacterium]|nr:hypothetical protein [Actinomycetota bacterium]